MRSGQRSRRSAASTSSSRTPAWRRAPGSRRRPWPSGSATTRSSAPGTSSWRARRSACSAARAAAYSSAKAAELHLARCLAEEGGADGIRVNTVNPDAVLQGSRIWDSSWREERAAAYGIEPGQLEEHYRKRTTLGVNIVPDDIAEAVLHFASGVRSGKSTGNVLNVDGGVPAAYPR
jgi:NAD(P)-dependent dehydrogenase (short-subunit alcohol dehydrogenase family)